MRIFLKTYGCQMNERDSELIAGLLEKAGYELVETDDRADIVIINTCSVRQHAEDRVFSLLGIYKDKIIGIVGCMAQNYKEKIFERAPGVSFVVGPQDINKIPGIIKLFIQGKKGQSPKSGDSPFFERSPKSGDNPLFERRIWETDSLIRPEEIYHTNFHGKKEHAYVVISEGCSNFCSYCVVPNVRGALRHRPVAGILQEINEAIDKGITSFTLLGQNVNAYDSDNINFADLLNMVNGLKGLKEFGFMTSHPKDTNQALFLAIKELDKLKKQLHLPLQSGSDRILKLMNRGYTSEFYLSLIDDYRKTVKNGLISTDIIVGFPTETEEDFKRTCQILKNTRFNAAYLFKYSERPNTAALKLGDDVPLKEKERRHKLLLELQKEISGKKKK